MASLASAQEWPDYSTVSPPANAATLLNAASGAIRNYCGWSISAEIDITTVLDGTGTSLLFLPTLLLTAVSAVVENGVALTADQWRKSRAGMLRRVGSCWPGEFESVSVTYSHGHTPVPDEIKALCVSLAARHSTTKPGKQSETIGNYAYRNAAEVPGTIVLARAEETLLNRYAIR